MNCYQDTYRMIIITTQYKMTFCFNNYLMLCAYYTLQRCIYY